MSNEQHSLEMWIRGLETQGLRGTFMELAAKARGRDWFLALPGSLEEKAGLDRLVDAGLIIITDQDFRYDTVSGRINANEVICTMTDLGWQVATALGVPSDP